MLFVASECAPFVKTGGLADVVAALPKALGREGLDVRVLLPAYRALSGLVGSGRELGRVRVPDGADARLVAVEADGLALLLLVAPSLYDRPGDPYLSPQGTDWPDNVWRFAALGCAAACIGTNEVEGWRPDIVHAHDWQAGLAPAYLHFAEGARPATVTTIHNIAFQGLFPGGLTDRLGLPRSGLNPEGFEYWGQMSFLKAGLVYADRITTVSPTYARELMTSEFGMGFEGIMQATRQKFSGILNGIDTDVWNPGRDGALPAAYGPDSLEKRARNSAALEARFALDPAPGAPIFIVVSRLTRQKGLDLLLDVLPDLLARGARLALLGSGDADLEDGFRRAAESHHGQVGVVFGYDEPLSHLMQGGGDCILIPSRFEPCGLTQLYGLRYGCVPLVARKGGLADTIIDANEAALAKGVATGFQFAPATAASLGQAIDRACEVFADRASWRRIMANGMHQTAGWDRSARAYRMLYQDLLAARKMLKRGDMHARQ